MNIEIVSTKRPYCSSSRRGLTPCYIVVHYSGMPDVQGSVIARSFAREYVEENDRLSSAHYVVDKGVVYRAIDPEKAAWHVGNGKPDRGYAGYRHAKRWHETHPGFCGNRISIGVELTCDKKNRGSKRAEDDDWTISEETLHTAADLCAELCVRYVIPVGHIIRHYDCTGKPCPRPLVSLPKDGNDSRDKRWAAFLSQVSSLLGGVGHADT